VLNDGYGEQMSPQQVADECEQIIASPWADRMVRAVMKWDSPDLPDLAQEARLTMWQAASRWDGKGTLVGFLHQAARYRVFSLLAGDHTYTGQEPRRAVTQRRGDASRDRLRSAVAAFKREHGRDPSAPEMAAVLGIHEATVRKQMRNLHLGKIDQQVQVSSAEALVEAYGTEAILGVEQHLDEVALAYHYGEIHEAVADLEPVWRQYVYLRFWEGYGDQEVARALGTRVHWPDRVRPMLAERLAHLMSAV
jgi:DNA-directed RNA polymerase specialized sigma24 family protein